MPLLMALLARSTQGVADPLSQAGWSSGAEVGNPPQPEQGASPQVSARRTC